MADRYPSDPGDPMKALEERLRLLEAKVEEQNRRNPLNNGVFSGTLRNVDAAGNTLLELDGNGMKVYDADGVLLLRLSGSGLRMYDDIAQTRAFIGRITTGNYGVRVRDGENGIRFSVDDEGYHDPWLAHPWRGVLAPARESTSSASFVSLWRSRVELLTHKGVACTAAWVTDAATTGEVRLRHGSAQTNAVALAAGSSGTQQFQWLHGLDLGGGPIDFEFQVRVTGGAGQVHLDEPFGGLEMADPDQCTTTGL